MTEIRLHVGTYAAEGGGGLYPLGYDPDRGLTVGAPVEHVRDASFGVRSSRHRLVYLLREQDAGSLGAYRLNDDRWPCESRVPTGGRQPCYIALDPSERRLAVANYGSGSVALYHLDATGLPGAPAWVWTNQGRGPDPERQDGPHMHCVRFSPDGRWLYAVDLGTDQLLAFRMDGGDPASSPVVAWRAPAGAGPRHLVFHPDPRWALLVSELAATLSLLAVDEESVSEYVTLPTQPADFRGENLGGHLAVNAAGNRVYVTNRGHDSIGVFALDTESGTLQPIQHIASTGASPRFFLLLEDIGALILANEEGDNVIAYRIAADGLLTRTAEARIPGPAFLFRFTDG